MLYEKEEEKYKLIIYIKYIFKAKKIANKVSILPEAVCKKV